MTSLRDQLQQSLGTTYAIDRELGGGGMSRVFVTRDTTLRRDVVVKVLPPELVAGVNVERFRREILVAAGLQHPHIVPVLMAGEMDGLPWFTMPFVQGESLRQRLARGSIPITEAVGILRDVAKALAYAHQHGVVHRDIKPDNVLLSGGAAVVTDFGIAKALSASRAVDHSPDSRGATLTQLGMSIGTPMYMAPEQAAADPNTDTRADIYSFGCVAYELLTGRPPFSGMTPQRLLAAHMSERPTPVAELRPDVPAVLAELVMHCLEKQAERRPQRAADLVRLLEVATTSGDARAAQAALLGRHVRLPVALGAWAITVGAAYILAKAAIVGIGLPSWVLPGALILAALGLPAILFTAFIQRTARRALITTPTLTPGGSLASPGALATLAVRASPHMSWRRTVRAGVVAFGVFVLLVAAFMAMRAFGIGPAGSLLAAGRITAREPIIVTDFSVKRGDSTLAGVVAEATRASLGQSSAITLVTPEAIAAALGRMQRPPTSRVDLTLARELAQREGIKAVVDGDVTSLGNGYVVTIRLVTTDSGAPLAVAQRVADSPKELIAAVDAITRDLRGKLGESLRAVQAAPQLERVTTPSIDALKKYSEGLHAFMGADFASAVSALREAVAQDSTFAMAWRLLGSAAALAPQFPRGVADSALTRAYTLRDRLPPAERLMTTASYFAGPGRDRRKAIDAWADLFARGYNAPEAYRYGTLLSSRRDVAKAESVFAAVIRAYPDEPPAYFNLLEAYVSQGKRQDAERIGAEIRRRFTSPGLQLGAALLPAVTIQDAWGEFAAMDRPLDSALAANVPLGSTSLASSPSGYFLSLLLGRKVRLSEMRGRPTETAPLLARLGVRPLEDSIYLAMIDIVALNQSARAVKRIEAALAATPLSAMPAFERDYLNVASVYAAAGRADRARAILAQRAAEERDTSRLRVEMPLQHDVLGLIALAEGRPHDAVREFWQADSLPDGPKDGCDACTYAKIARAYDRAAIPDSAIVYFEKFFASTFAERVEVDWFQRAPAARRLGELYEAKGERGKAVHYYQSFVDLWKNAEPEFQPQVAEIRKRIEHLGDASSRETTSPGRRTSR